ncbi:MAG: hypothetical protein EPN59_02285 [Paraburkholderia sp.]|uniref:PQQ-binding-like beta-propeller repeat protein n=1 Tax=Paraburkholderia sp. TaxID=1926495 RepID=UPI001220A9C6|nr:PQQ-binding-like beta-propeller repeat protein [Paraburkholderia sp.]TAM32182.1 MAG: hypothetical protein EPN59_02285 [Paraburkholderia sp.]
MSSPRLEMSWCRNIDGLVRVPIFDPKDDSRAYVTVYIEKRRTYEAHCFDPRTGVEIWRTTVDNGGYGTPAIRDGQLVLLTAFSNVTALDTGTGRELWTVQTSARIRSGVAVSSNGLVVLSSGNQVLGIDAAGQLAFSYPVDECFLFGKVAFLTSGDMLTMGTRTDAKGHSEIFLAALGTDGKVRWRTALSLGNVASSDTSGIVIDGQIAIAGAVDGIFAVDIDSGRIIWRVDVEGDAHRHACVSDGSRVFFTTAEGYAGAIDVRTGRMLWQRMLAPYGVWSPPTILGDRVAFEADGLMHIVLAQSGMTVQQQAVGQTPYSTLAIKDNRALLGGGDPPYFGLLFGFVLVESSTLPTLSCDTVQQVQTFRAYEDLNVAVRISGEKSAELASVTVDFSCLGETSKTRPEIVDGDTYIFRVTPGAGYQHGSYALPIMVNFRDSTTWYGTSYLKLESDERLPTRTLITDIGNFEQEQPYWSGAACIVAAKKLFGEEVDQASVMGMIEAIQAKADDYFPFDIWRIIARRAMTTSAHSVTGLPEFQGESSTAQQAPERYPSET